VLAVFRYLPYRLLFAIPPLYQEVTYGAFSYQTCKSLVAKDRVSPIKAAERYNRLVCVQDYGAGNTGIYSSDQVLASPWLASR
jgi:hypothetical protein